MDIVAARLKGSVNKEKVAEGSKSERFAVVLHASDGRIFPLRRNGGNNFADPKLDELIGHEIEGVGFVAGPTFIMNDWKITG